MEEMYLDTHVQPLTGLQERLHLGDSGRNEVRHRVFNEANVAAGLKRRSLLAAMEKAAMNRETQINEVKEKAQKQVEEGEA